MAGSVSNDNPGEMDSQSFASYVADVNIVVPGGNHRRRIEKSLAAPVNMIFDQFPNGEYVDVWIGPTTLQTASNGAANNVGFSTVFDFSLRRIGLYPLRAEGNLKRRAGGGAPRADVAASGGKGEEHWAAAVATWWAESTDDVYPFHLGTTQATIVIVESFLTQKNVR